MQPLKKIKEKITHSMISRKARKISKGAYFLDLRTAKNIAILFDLNKNSNFETINQFKTCLANKGKSIQLLGYNNSKKLEHNYNDIIVYSNDDIKMNAKSTNKALNELMLQPIDLLLVLNNNNSLATHYVISLSQAHCKIGALKDFYQNLDFFIEMLPYETDKLIKEIKKYIV